MREFLKGISKIINFIVSLPIRFAFGLVRFIQEIGSEEKTKKDYFAERLKKLK